MAHIAPARPKINTEVTQAASGQASRRAVGRGKSRQSARGPARVAGDARRSARDPGRPVLELDGGVTVYPPVAEGLAARIDAARAEQQAGANPLGPIFPSPKGSTGGPPTSTGRSPLPGAPQGLLRLVAARLVTGCGGPGRRGIRQWLAAAASALARGAV